MLLTCLLLSLGAYAQETTDPAPAATPADAAGTPADAEAPADAPEAPAEPPAPSRVVIAPPPASPWVGTPQAMARYDRLRLRVVDTPATGDFVVRDGNGYSYDAFAFARATQDLATLDVLERRAKRVRWEMFSIVSGGVAVAALSIVPLVLIEPVKSPDQSDYVLDPNDFPSEDSYQVAQADATALYELALLQTQSVAGRNENRRWTALTLGSAGSLIMFAGTVHHDHRIGQFTPVHTTYGRARAEELVERYNEGLRARLDIHPATEEDAAPPAPEGGEEGPPVPEGADLIELPPPPLQIQPFVAPGMIGIKGRF